MTVASADPATLLQIRVAYNQSQIPLYKAD